MGNCCRMDFVMKKEIRQLQDRVNFLEKQMITLFAELYAKNKDADFLKLWHETYFNCIDCNNTIERVSDE